MHLKNITYRIDHEVRVILKPLFHIHSNKRLGSNLSYLKNSRKRQRGSIWIWTSGMTDTVSGELINLSRKINQIEDIFNVYLKNKRELFLSSLD